MDRSKFVAVVTGAISILLAIVYLLVVQLLDFRGEMKPAPIDDFLVVPHAVIRSPLSPPPWQGGYTNASSKFPLIKGI